MIPETYSRVVRHDDGDGSIKVTLACEMKGEVKTY